MKNCDYGCGREAKHQFKNGKWCCEDHYSKCSKNKEKCFLGRKHLIISRKKMSISKKESFVEIPIDENILCEYGCGRPAKYIVNLIRQKFCCSKYYNSCSFMILINKETSGKANREIIKCQIHAELMKKENPMFIEEYKKKVIKITSSSKYKEKMARKIEELWLDSKFREKVTQGRIDSGTKIPDAELTKFRRYYYKVYHYTRKSIKKYKDVINPDNKPIGKEKGLYNVDHIYSIFDGFINKVEAKIIGSYINLQVIPWIINLQKQRKSWITKEVLIEKYEGIDENLYNTGNFK